MKETYKIKGMSCASCVRNVEKIALKEKGVINVNVNLILEELYIEYNKDFSFRSLYDNLYKYNYKINREEEKESNYKLLVMIIFSLFLLYVTMGPMINLPLPNIIDMDINPVNYSLFQLILLTPIVVFGINIYIIGLKLLIKRKPSMFSLIALGTICSFIYSMYYLIMVLQGDFCCVHELYFESVGIIITLVYLGKYFESKIKSKTSSSILGLINLTPKKVLILDGEEEKEKSIESINIGEIVIIKDGEYISVDGTIIKGSALIDQSTLTGESLVVERFKDDSVFAGTINKSGYIHVEVNKAYTDSLLSNIIKSVKQASINKTKIEKLVDKISYYFIPLILIIALITFSLWMIITKDISLALKTSVSILVIACPCALALATPAAIVVASGVGAKNLILFKSGEVLETAANIDIVVFDKTNTLTTGDYKIVEIKSERTDALLIAASLEQISNHPLSKAFIEKAKEYNLKLNSVSNYGFFPGIGMFGEYDSKLIYVCSVEGLVKLGIENTYEYETDVKVLYLIEDGKLIASFGLKDTIKYSSYYAVKLLKEKGYEVMLLSGDNDVISKDVGNSLGITNIKSNVLPLDKAKVIESLINEGKKVMMVGDGINDAVALKSATVGVSITGSSDVAINSADVVLIVNDINYIWKVLSLCKKTFKVIKRNLFFSFIYNLIGVIIAAGILYGINGFLLNPMIAALAMSLSSISLILSTLGLKLWKP